MFILLILTRCSNFRSWLDIHTSHLDLMCILLILTRCSYFSSGLDVQTFHLDLMFKLLILTWFANFFSWLDVHSSHHRCAYFPSWLYVLTAHLDVHTSWHQLYKGWLNIINSKCIYNWLELTLRKCPWSHWCILTR